MKVVIPALEGQLIESLEGEANLAMEIENGMKILTNFLWSWVILLIGGLHQLNSIP